MNNNRPGNPEALFTFSWREGSAPAEEEEEEEEEEDCEDPTMQSSSS